MCYLPMKKTEWDVLDALAASQLIETLRIGNDDIHPRDAESLLPVLDRFIPTLLELTFADISMSPTSSEAVFEGLKAGRVSSLTFECEIHGHVVNAIIQHLKESPHIKELSLSPLEICPI